MLVLFKRLSIRESVHYKRIFVFVISVFLVPAAFAEVVSIEQLYQEGIKARLEQNFELARAKLERAAKLVPDDADIHVQLGFTYLALDEVVLAKQSFQVALKLAPQYVDAKYGLALVAFRQGEFDEAQQLVSQVVKERENYTDALSLQKNISNAQIAHNLVNRKWRLDISGEYSGVSNGMDDWSEGNIALSYKATPNTTIIAGTQVARRFDETDKKFILTLAHKFNDRWAGYGTAAVTPNANFLAKYTMAAGGSYVVSKGNEYLQATVLTLDVQHDEYREGAVRTITPGVQQYLWAGRLMLTGKSINIYQEHGGYASGYLFKSDLEVTDKLQMFGGYSNSLEPSDNKMIRTEATFTGVAYAISEDVTIRLNYTHEHRRNAYTRDIFGVGLTWLH